MPRKQGLRNNGKPDRKRKEEGPPLTFIGTSQVVGPDAAVLVRASKTREALMIVEIKPKKARGKSIDRFNDLF